MRKNDRTPAAEGLTELILAIFRVNNLVVSWGDRMVADIGLTSARWQILGAIVAAEQPQPVAWLARDLGVNRQNVQRIVKDLHKDDMVYFVPNPHHKRAHLILLTDKGRSAYEEAIARYNPRINRLAEPLPAEEIEKAFHVLKAFRAEMERNDDAEKSG